MTDLGRLGIPGVIGAGLLLFCLSFGLSTVAPDKTARDRLISEEARLVAMLPARTVTSPSPHQSATPPPLSSAQEIFANLDTLAETSGVPVEQAGYRLTEDEGYTRYEVTLPLKGSYPALRSFITEALALSPTAYLDELTLQRSAAADPTILANIRLVYVFAGP